MGMLCGWYISARTTGGAGRKPIPGDYDPYLIERQRFDENSSRPAAAWVLARRKVAYSIQASRMYCSGKGDKSFNSPSVWFCWRSLWLSWWKSNIYVRGLAKILLNYRKKRSLWSVTCCWYCLYTTSLKLKQNVAFLTTISRNGYYFESKIMCKTEKILPEYIQIIY